MAELATIARPYAEALYRSIAGAPRAAETVSELAALAQLAGHAELLQLAGNPSVRPEQVHALVTGMLPAAPSPAVANLLSLVLENGRLAALPEIARQVEARVNAQGGVSSAVVHSAFALDAAALETLGSALERRFGRKLELAVQIDETLIGGVRVVVGDEVLDLSVQARLAQMKAALIA